MKVIDGRPRSTAGRGIGSYLVGTYGKVRLLLGRELGTYGGDRDDQRIHALNLARRVVS